MYSPYVGKLSVSSSVAFTANAPVTSSIFRRPAYLNIRRPGTRLKIRTWCYAPAHQVTYACTRRTTDTRAVYLPDKLATLCKEFACLDSEIARVLALIRLGDDMELLPSSKCSRATRVAGCTAVVHVLVDFLPEDNSRIAVSGTADARVTRGLLSLFIRGLNGATVADILELNAEDIITASNLALSTTPSRNAGLRNLLTTIQDRVRALSQERTKNPSRNSVHDAAFHDVHAASPIRYTSKQAEDVAVLLSGGVDSSVALRLVQETGVRPHPFYLKIWLEDELAHLGQCPWEEDLAYANAVCEQLGLAVEPVPLQQEYWDRVVAYTVAEARAGRTPNPDIMCNSRVKFGAFYDCIGNQFSKVITGHYAQSELSREGLVQLLRSVDPVKDQTYFLSHLQQNQVAKAHFPVGKFTKNEVRDLACKYALPNRGRKDSQGICFLGKLKFDDFLLHHLGTNRGPLVEFETGLEVGTHRGFWFYTLGQRRGIGLSGGPWYVTAKDPSENIVFVSKYYNDEDKARNEFDFEKASWITGSWPRDLDCEGKTTHLQVKIRHGPRYADCVVTRAGEATGHVRLNTRDLGLAPGQFAVFYADNICLGSGVISDNAERHRTHRIKGSVSIVKLQSHYKELKQ